MFTHLAYCYLVRFICLYFTSVSGFHTGGGGGGGFTLEVSLPSTSFQPQKKIAPPPPFPKQKSCYHVIKCRSFLVVIC